MPPRTHCESSQQAKLNLAPETAYEAAPTFVSDIRDGIVGLLVRLGLLVAQEAPAIQALAGAGDRLAPVREHFAVPMKVQSESSAGARRVAHPLASRVGCATIA